MITRRNRKSSSDKLAEINADPAFQNEKRRREEELQARTEVLHRAEAQLVDDLRANGADVSSVWDLVNMSAPYPKLVPVLISHMDRPYPDRIREGIFRALAVPEARHYWDELVRRYASEPDPSPQGPKWALHLALSAAADESVIEDLISLATDRQHGRNRALFMDALARMKDPRARVTLEQLRDDPDLTEDVKRVLGRTRRTTS